MARDWAFVRYMTAMSCGPKRGRHRRPRDATDAPRRPGRDERLHLARDPLGLLVLAVRLEALDEHAARVLRPELLVLARLVAADDRMCRIQDQLRGAVVLLQLDDRGLGVVALEVEDVAQVRAAPGVDRLVVVAHDARFRWRRREMADPQVLRPVRVLVLVDVQVAPPLLVVGQHVGRLVEQAHGLVEQVVEVERAAALSRSRSAGVGLANAAPGSWAAFSAARRVQHARSSSG